MPGETFEEALARVSPPRSVQSRLAPDFEASWMSALQVAVPFGELSPHLIPEWPSRWHVEEGFRRIRDDRFLALPESPGTPRTISWRYPYDGCFARAAVAAEHLETAAGLRRPAKVFIYGPLALQTSTAGYISWWYHVAPVVSHAGTAYVLDPAVDPSGPLTLEQWSRRMTRDLAQVSLSICNPYAYNPWSHCYISGPDAESRAVPDIQAYLRAEELSGY